jgi:hypothetical protein
MSQRFENPLTFRREFGHTPSEVRRASTRTLREISKNLKV